MNRKLRPYLAFVRPYYGHEDYAPEVWAAIFPSNGKFINSREVWLVYPKEGVTWGEVEGDVWSAKKIGRIFRRTLKLNSWNTRDAKIASRIILDSYLGGFPQIPSYILWALEIAIEEKLYPAEILEGVLWEFIEKYEASLDASGIRKSLRHLAHDVFDSLDFSLPLYAKLVSLCKDSPTTYIVGCIVDQIQEKEKAAERLLAFLKERPEESNQLIKVLVRGLLVSVKDSSLRDALLEICEERSWGGPPLSPLSYIAFKGLATNGNNLLSPITDDEWEGDPPTMERRSPKHGVYAAAWGIAAHYEETIFAVVPYFYPQDEKASLRVGLLGWEADKAMIVAGPWHRKDIEGMKVAAGMVLESFRAGFPQVPGVLLWASLVEIAHNPSADDLLLRQAIESSLPQLGEDAQSLRALGFSVPDEAEFVARLDALLPPGYKEKAFEVVKHLKG